ncbi:MAG: ABC transporter permease [Chloroflexi bacterium]|nr:ABC transporter permease [Chloroflexota bacterium]
MTTSAALPTTAERAQPPRVRRATGLRRFAQVSPVGAISLALLLFVLFVAAFADQLAPRDPLTTSLTIARRPPSLQNWLGTDNLGRDVLSRLIHGTRVTMTVVLISVALGDTVGFLWGLTSGYLGNRFDLLSQRLLDILMAFPALILAMLLLTGLGAGLHTVIVAIAVTRVPLTTRVIRSVTLSVKEQVYVTAAQSVGATSFRIMARHVAPQCIAPLLVILSFNLGTAIFAEAALNFLGVGLPPPAPTWGSMLGGVLAETFRPQWWLLLFPGLAITLTITATNLLGDALRDFLDPHLKRQMQLSG